MPLEILTGFATAPGAAFTNLGGGDFAAGGIIPVRNFPQQTRAFLLNYWGWSQAGTAITQITSPRMHDAIVGIRHRPIAAQVFPLMSDAFPAELYSQDRVQVQVQGSAVGGDLEVYAFLIHYQSQPGSDGTYISWDQLQQYGQKDTTVEVPLVAALLGGWSGAAAGNSGTQALKPNVRYALVGGHTSLIQAAIGIRCTDFGNFRIGFPGNAADKRETTNFFADLSRAYLVNGRPGPFIPVFNSASLPNMLVDTANNENAASPVVTLNVVELGS